MTDFSELFNIRISDGISLVDCHADLSLQQAKWILQRLYELNAYHFRCFIFHDSVKLHLSHHEVIELSDFSMGLFHERNCVAFVAGSDLTYGTMRELSVYREQKSHADVAVFRQLDIALTWLKEKQQLFSEL